jgi:hypothetical protein
MSNHGPAGAPYPDEPGERYEPPSDPWAGQDVGQDVGQGLWGGEPEPSYDGPAAPDAGYPPAPAARLASSAPAAWHAPVPPVRRGPSAGLIALLVVVVVLVLGGVGTAVWYLTGRDAVESVDVHSAIKGQCVVNNGSGARPDMQVSSCDEAEAFEIVARFDGTVDYAARCKGVPGYTNHYFYDGPDESQDFVLCLKSRS